MHIEFDLGWLRVSRASVDAVFTFRLMQLTNNICHLETMDVKHLLPNFLFPIEGDLFFYSCLSWLSLGLSPLNSA